jgi:hypothetical protein
MFTPRYHVAHQQYAILITAAVICLFSCSHSVERLATCPASLCWQEC